MAINRETNITAPQLVVPGGMSMGGGQRAEEACLVVLHGDSIGQRIRLVPPSMTVGRAVTAELRFDHESVSRLHCRFEPIERVGRPPEGWRVVDLGSTNGTF